MSAEKTTPDYAPPGKRVLPEPVKDGALIVLPSSPTKVFIRCTCGHAAWRTAPGVDEWECGCRVGPRSCHAPRQVADAEGIPQIVWGPYRIKPFPAPA